MSAQYAVFVRQFFPRLLLFHGSLIARTNLPSNLTLTSKFGEIVM